MTIKSDNWIKRMAIEHKMIDPFVENQVRSGVISFVPSSYGYDIRVGDEFKVFTKSVVEAVTGFLTKFF